jgi:hypothetical protein
MGCGAVPAGGLLRGDWQRGLLSRFDTSLPGERPRK